MVTWFTQRRMRFSWCCCYYCYYWSLCTALWSALGADSLRSCHMWFSMNGYPFKTILFYLFNIYRSGVLTALFGCCMADATWNRWLLDAASCVWTVMQPYTTLQCHFIQNHVGRVDVGGCVFSYILPHALLAEWPGSYMWYWSNTGVARIPK